VYTGLNEVDESSYDGVIGRGKPSADLISAAQQVSGCIDRPVVDLGV